MYLSQLSTSFQLICPLSSEEVLFDKLRFPLAARLYHRFLSLINKVQQRTFPKTKLVTVELTMVLYLIKHPHTRVNILVLQMTLDALSRQTYVFA